MEIINVDNTRDLYFEETFPKRMIVLHHTVSSNADSAIRWWRQLNNHTATAFIIDKAGVIYKVFNPAYWAWHIGVKNGKDASRASIGIELVNEGLLIKEGERYEWCDGKGIYKGEVYESDANWRGSRYFAKYPDAQFNACAELVSQLCGEFKIPKQVITNYCFKQEYLNNYYGVLSHHNLRADKSDVSLAFDLNIFQTLIKGA